MATTKPTTSFSGLATGIDSASLIDSMVSIAKIPITKLQEKQAVNTKVSKKFTDLKARLAALKTAAQALDTRGETLVNKASSSNEASVKVTGTGGSALGTYNVVVTSLAQSQRTYSEPVGSNSSAGLFGNGELTMQVGSGTAKSIIVTDTDTLQTVADKINAAGAGLSAGIMFDGTNYRLQVASTAMGAANAVTFTEDPGLSLGLSTPANTIQHATDAVLSVDGFPITGTSNTISNALPGVSLSLTGPGSSQLKIERDPDGLKTKLDAFVSAYNGISSFMNSEFTNVSGVAKTADTLSGDSALRSLQTQLRNALGSNWSAISPFPTMSSTGLVLGRDNTLSVDTAKLSAAVNQDYEGVASLFAGAGGADGLMAKITNLVNDVTGSNGTVTSKINSLAAQNRDYDKSIDRIQLRIDKYQEMLSRQFAALEQTASGLQSQGNSLISTLNAM